jgi:hypothetical protein
MQDGLTPRQIVESFPLECAEYVENNLRKLRTELDGWLKADRYVIDSSYEMWHKTYLLGLLNMMKPAKKFKQYESLQQMKKMMGVDTPLTTTLDLDKAKEISIVTLHNFKKAKMFGNRFTACCPFGHKDDTPSFVVYPDNRFHCFSCKESGSSIDFVMKLHDLNFIAAVKFLHEQN